MRSLSRAIRGLLHALGLGAVLATLPGQRLGAQTRTLTACTPDVLAICAELQLSGGASYFQIGLRTIGSTSQPSLPVSFYNLVLGTGAPAAAIAVSTLLPPMGVGGAIVSDPSVWEVFDTGDLLFLSALSNRGVGGCAVGPDVDGFGQAVTTCGAGQFAMFRFAPTTAFNVRQFQILDLEAVALGATADGASCGAPGSDCLITADVTTPEPATVVLVGIGLLLVASARRARESRAGRFTA